METRQVLLICLQPLLGEGLQHIFQKMEDVELVTLNSAELPVIAACLSDLHPDMVLLAGEKEDDAATHLISYMLKQYEDIPIVWAELETSVLRLYTAHVLTASSASLLRAIHASDIRKMRTDSSGRNVRHSRPKRR